jgi:serine/threonine protein kinase
MKHPITLKIIRVCISDFGTSRETEMGKIYSTMTGSIMYWAPEQRVGNYNSKADSK